MANERFECMLSEFLESSDTKNQSKPCYRVRVRKGIRKNNLNVKKLNRDNSACIKLIVKSPTKKYYKVKKCYDCDDKTKAELKRECNRYIRRNCGDIPSGSYYKKSVVKDFCAKNNIFICDGKDITEVVDCDTNL